MKIVPGVVFMEWSDGEMIVDVIPVERPVGINSGENLCGKR
jgi:hypothetical protein